MSKTSVYIHFPWCARKCPYCDFATSPREPERVPSEAYAEAVLRELTFRLPELEHRELYSVFFGGGTPSLWDPASLGGVLQGVIEAFPKTQDNLEVTAECNPNSLTQQKAAALYDVGVNRLSIGVQSLRDPHLRFLGRLHDRKEALAALSGAVQEVPRVSADLMFGLPDQTEAELVEDIDAVIDTGVRHVSAYALTIEPATTFGSLHKKGLLRVATEDAYANLFERAESHFAERGFSHYEVSNYAMQNEESRHNEHYWRGGDYLGLGAAAVGCLQRKPGAARRWRNHPDPARYMDAKDLSELEESEEILGQAELVQEALMLGLRTTAGVDLVATQKRSGSDPLESREQAVMRAIEQGNLIVGNSHLRVPQQRWLKLDSIVRDLF